VAAGRDVDAGNGTGRRLVAATRGAWRELAFDRAEELCRLAAWRGAGAEVAEIRASLLLLRAGWPPRWTSSTRCRPAPCGGRRNWRW